MLADVRYQVFISSTFEDLREERQQATQAILEAGCFPSGMELFPASDDSQWQLIQRVIGECDYYIVIAGGRYGSLGPEGKSYTEMEYDFAIQSGIPVLGFVRSNPEDISFAKTERTDKNRKKLDSFRQKVQSRTCKPFDTPAELGMAVMKSIMSEARIRPRVGWIRADQARSQDDVKREKKLNDSLKRAEDKIELLQRTIRDGRSLGNEVERSSLAQGDEIFKITISYTDQAKNHVREDIPLSLDQIFQVIGPSIYGFVVRKRTGYGQAHTYPFQDDLEEHIRLMILEKIQSRKIKIESSQIDTLAIQYKELGLIEFHEKKEKGGGVFRGVILTEAGEKHLVRLKTHIR